MNWMGFQMEVRIMLWKSWWHEANHCWHWLDKHGEAYGLCWKILLYVVFQNVSPFATWQTIFLQGINLFKTCRGHATIKQTLFMYVYHSLIISKYSNWHFLTMVVFLSNWVVLVDVFACWAPRVQYGSPSNDICSISSSKFDILGSQI